MSYDFERFQNAMARLLGRADANLRASQLLRESDHRLSTKMFNRARIQLIAATRVHRKSLTRILE